MTVTIAATVNVPMPALVAALKSVVVHAEPTKTGDDVSSLSRVRLILGDGELSAVATNSTTSACGHVEILEDSRDERFAADDGVFGLDLPVYWTKKLVGTFRPGKPGADAEEQEIRLAVDVEAKFLTVTDVTGLWPGASLVVPLLPYSSDYPDVLEILAEAWRGASGAGAKPLVTPVGPLALFRHAGVAYKPDRLVFEPTGSTSSRGFLVWCGPDFEGHVSSHHDEDSLRRRDAMRHGHLLRHGLVAKAPENAAALLGAPVGAGV